VDTPVSNPKSNGNGRSQTRNVGRVVKRAKLKAQRKRAIADYQGVSKLWLNQKTRGVLV